MKQLIFLVLFPSLIFSQSIIIKDSDKIIKTAISKESNKIHIFYNDKVSIINLTTLKLKDTVFDFNGFDISNLLFINSHSKNYFIDPQGGGTFLLKNYSLSKIDKSFKHQMQIEASVFIYKENIYKYGGYGFWSDRDFITQFDLTTYEWELVPFFNSNTIPKGRHKSITKVIGDDLYVIGGITLNKFNPLLFDNNNEVWKFDLVHGLWEKLGEIRDWSDNFLDYVIIDFDDKLIIDNTDRDILHEIDIVNNTVKSFNKTSFTRKINNSTFPMFFYKNKFYGFFKENNSLNKQTLLKRNSDEIFGKLIAEDRFYKKRINFINYIFYVFAFLILIILGYLVYKKSLVKNKIIIRKNGNLYYNTKKIVLEPKGLLILKHLLNSKEPLYSKDIILLLDKPHIEYSHKTRMLNDILYKINYNLKQTIKTDDNIITVIKSSFDRRLKVYSINKDFL